MKDKIIEDYKNTISRLQQECTEKTNVIIALGEQLKAKEQECETLASQLDFEVQKKECLEQECEELKRKVELMMDCPDCKVDEYKKALEEIEEVCIEYTREFADGATVHYYSLDEILDIINKAKGEG